MSLAEKRQRAMQTRSRLPLDERCKLMSISRSGIYYKPKKASALLQLWKKAYRNRRYYTKRKYLAGNKPTKINYNYIWFCPNNGEYLKRPKSKL